MDYYKPMRDQYIHNEMYPTDYRKDYFPKGASNDSLKLGHKPPCAPKFVTKIEGNAVEEGARVFFEGIVDSQPQPVFTWYFDDEEIFPGEPGWEEVEIHHSRKMSTLIIRYTREHHMGKYSLLAKNRMGNDLSNCDLIVRKKQFPPVFWKRLNNLETTSGSRIVAEVEVGGWPLPEIVWYKDGEVVVSRVHTENYNGFPNKYVPERRIEVRRIDEIRYCLVFHRISENDSGLYTCRAVNPLGEALSEAEFLIEAGEGGSEDLYLPEKWLTGNRLTWKDEDARLKPFVGVQEPPLTDEDIARMTKGAATTPLPRSMEYFATLPDYQPIPLSAYGFVPMNFSPDSALKNVKPKVGKKGGQVSRPSKFVPGEIIHYGYGSDDIGRILPIWVNPLDQNPIDPNLLEYNLVDYIYPDVPPRPPRAKSPDGPPVWETQADLDRLHAMLANSGFRLDLAAIRKDQLGNASQARRQNVSSSALKDQVKARKNLMQNTPKRGENAAAREWEARLNADVAGAQANAEDFTKQFMSQMYDNQVEETSTTSVTTSKTTTRQEEAEMVVESPPPALPPKTKIMFSPSRDVFSPTNQENPEPIIQSPPVREEFIPVKEKAKMIEQQQEEIERREETGAESEDSAPRISGETLKGGVRILPPSPVTVRKEAGSSSTMISSSYTQKTFESTTVTEDSRPSHIPVLEDKYNVNDNLEELADSRSDLQSPITTQKQQHHVTFQTSSSSIPRQEVSSRKTQQSYCMIISGQASSDIGGNNPRMVMDYASQLRDEYQRSRTTSAEAEFEALVREQEAEEKRRALQQVREHYQTPERKEQQRNYHFSESPALNLRQPTQSPVRSEEDRQQYRTPPSTPFQPAFYKTPVVDPNRVKHQDYKLPSQKARTSIQMWTTSSDGRTKTDTQDYQYDGDTEF